MTTVSRDILLHVCALLGVDASEVSEIRMKPDRVEVIRVFPIGTEPPPDAAE